MRFTNAQFMKPSDFLLRAGLILLGLIYPCIMCRWIGPLPSISEYFMTAAQPIFLLINAGTSFYFVTTHNWRIPGVLLLALSCFSLEYYPTAHTIMAALFFLWSIAATLAGKRYRFLAIGMILSGFGLFHSIFLAEVLAIFFICMYHSLILYDLYELYRKRNNIIQYHEQTT